KKVAELICQSYVEKPATTLATEVAKNLLDGLWNNNVNPLLLNVYKAWLDSVSYKASFQNYLGKYKPGKKANPFEIHLSHPFLQIDELWLKEIGKQLDNASFILSILPKVNQRNSDKAANGLGITFWKQVKTLLEFDEKNINQISSFKEAVD